MTIEYLKGDATAPSVDGNKIILHVCNDIGGWGKGFVVALSKRWPEPEAQFRLWFEDQTDFLLGNIQLVQVENSLWVCNLIGQRDIKSKNGVPPIRYKAIADGLQKLAIEAETLNATVHMPRIGCGLAGGSWDRMEPIIENALTDKGIKTFVYDFA